MYVVPEQPKGGLTEDEITALLIHRKYIVTVGKSRNIINDDFFISAPG